MKTEIEVKFLRTNHDEVRRRLSELGAVCEQPMRVMRRAIIDYPDRRLQTGTPWSFIRVRDEGDKITVTYKQLDHDASLTGAREIETVVEDFDSMVAIFEASGLKCHSLQESKRETWKLGDVEIVLDEWPWVPPYIEIEGPSEQAVKDCAQQLAFSWNDAAFGDAMSVYRAEYPHLTLQDTLATLPVVAFNEPLPAMLRGHLNAQH